MYFIISAMFVALAAVLLAIFTACTYLVLAMLTPYFTPLAALLIYIVLLGILAIHIRVICKKLFGSLL